MKRSVYHGLYSIMQTFLCFFWSKSEWWSFAWIFFWKIKWKCLLTYLGLRDKFINVDLRNSVMKLSKKIAEKFLTFLKTHDKITKSLKNDSLRSLILSKKTSKKLLTNNKQRVMINGLLEHFWKTKSKKTFKKSWQTNVALIWYKSCYGNLKWLAFNQVDLWKLNKAKTNQMCRASWLIQDNKHF